MREMIIVSYDAGTTYTKHYVMVPHEDPAIYTQIGSIKVQGVLACNFMTYGEAEQYVKDNRDNP